MTFEIAATAHSCKIDGFNAKVATIKRDGLIVGFITEGLVNNPDALTAYIVCACNTHDALVKALREALAVLDAVNARKPFGNRGHDARLNGRKALTNAEGK